MGKYLITGIATSGKATGKSFRKLDIASAEDWVNRYDPSWDGQRLRQLLSPVRTEPAFFCGSASNEEQYCTLFGKAFLLAIDDPTLKYRLYGTGRANDFGRRPGELEVLFGWYQVFQERAKAADAITIDATQPLEKVVDEILRHDD